MSNPKCRCLLMLDAELGRGENKGGREGSQLGVAEKGEVRRRI